MIGSIWEAVHIWYSSVPNNCVGWNKCAGWNFHPKLINVQAGIIVQVGKFLNI